VHPKVWLLQIAPPLKIIDRARAVSLP